MPQLNTHPPPKNEPGASGKTDSGINNEEVENQNKYTRTLRSRKIVSSNVSKSKIVKVTTKPAKRKKPVKSVRRPPRGKHEPLYEERQHMLQNAQSSTESEEREYENKEEEEGVINGKMSQSRLFYTCKLCNKDFSSAFILCLHLQIHEKVGSVQTTKENITANEQDQESEVKLEPCQDANETFGTSIEDTRELNAASTEDAPTGILNKNFVENLKKNLSLAMNRQL